jgi:hypothetical protein
MFIAFLLFLLTCSSAPSTIETGQAVQTALLANMAKTVDVVRLNDNEAATEADKLIEIFRSQFAPLDYVEYDDHIAIRGSARCGATESRCFGFAAPHNKSGDHTIPGWMDGPALLVIPDALPADDLMAPFVAFHGLQKNAQFQRLAPPDPLPRVSGERWPQEREATELEIRLLEAATNGRFSQVVNDLVARERSHNLRTVTFGNVEYPALNGEAARIMPGISPIGADLLNMSIVYAFNMKLFTNTSDEIRDRTISTLQIGLGEREVQALYHP